MTNGLVPLALSGLGFLTAVASWFAAEGSKFWQENWERHIDALELAHEGNLHKTVWVGGDGVRWSVSGTNGWLNIFFSIFWGWVCISEFIASAKWPLLKICEPIRNLDWTAVGAVVIFLTTVVGFLLLWSRKTKFKGSLDVIEIGLTKPSLTKWPRIFTCGKTALSIVRREPPR